MSYITSITFNLLTTGWTVAQLVEKMYIERNSGSFSVAVITLCQLNTVEMDLNLGNDTENLSLTQGNPMVEFNIQ